MKRILLHALVASLSLSALSYGAEDNKDSKNEKTAEKPKRSKLATAASVVECAGAIAPIVSKFFGDDIDPKYIAAVQKAGTLVSKVTDKNGNLDYDKLNKTFAGKTARKKIVITFLSKIGLPEAEIAQFVNLDKAVTAIAIDIKTQKISVDKAELLKAIKSKQFSAKVAKLLKVPTEAVQNQLDMAKHILGEPIMTEEEAFKPEVIGTATKQIQQYWWHKGLITGSSYTLNGVLSLCGTYAAFTNPYTIPVYLIGAAASYTLGTKEQKKIDALIAEQEKLIEAQIAAQRKYFETQMQMCSLRTQAVGLGLHGAMNYLVGEEAIARFISQQSGASGDAASNAAADPAAAEAELKALLSSEFADEMGKFFVAIQDNTKAKAVLSNEEILNSSLVAPYLLLNEEEFIQALSKAEKDALIKALVKYVTHFFKPAQMLKFAQQISQFKAQPLSILKAPALLKTMSTEQLKSLHGILSLLNAPAKPNFVGFVQNLTEAHMGALSNPALLLIAEFNPEVLCGETDFITSISADEELQKAFAVLLNNK